PRGADCLANPKWIAFEWDPPEDDGGFPLRGYKILRAPESDPFNWQPIDPVSGVAVHQTNFTDKFTGSLVFGQYYSYRAVAMNGIDDLDHSNASEPLVALCTSPAAPARDYPPHSRTAVTVYWREVPGADGYRVYAKRDDYEAVSLIYDGMGLGGRLNFTHANLEAGVVYTYWLTALSAASESGWSLPLVAVAAELSGPPSVVPPKGPQDFRWQYPEDDGGTPVRSFQVLMERYNASQIGPVNWTAHNDSILYYRPWSTSLSRADLFELGRDYVLRVRAVTDAGEGESSSGVVVSGGQSTQLVALWLANVSRSHVELEWASPGFNTTMDVYVDDGNDGALVFWTGDISHARTTIGPLMTGKKYRVQV
ncbi:Myosin-binding protein C, slow-type, partial [Perkinsus olseni]